MLYIVLVVSFPNTAVSGLLPFILYPAVMMSLSLTPYKPLLSRMAVALPFALVIGLSNMALMRETAFTVSGVVVTTGFLSFVSIMLKTALCVFAVLLLIATTPFTSLAALLTRRAGVRVIGLQIVLTYRYISTLLGEAGDMWTAYMLRSPGAKALKMRDMGTFAGQLLLRSFDRAERVYYAMKCRGFSGVYYADERGRHPNRRADVVFFTVSGLTLLAFRFVPITGLLGALVSGALPTAR
jgi:cobalt/nickel transport system permease protein